MLEGFKKFQVGEHMAIQESRVFGETVEDHGPFPHTFPMCLPSGYSDPYPLIINHDPVS